jgi:hypothetical protein
MSSQTILYEFVFTGAYDETIFAQSPYARDSLRPKVQAAVATEQTFLSRFTKVNAIAQQVTDQGQTFKIRLNRVV